VVSKGIFWFESGLVLVRIAGMCMEMQPVSPELKAIIAEASQALARLDAPRLEELALSCQALNREMTPSRLVQMARQSRDATREMTAFARVLEATRANVRVMERLRGLHEGKLEYGDRQLAALESKENRYGLD
jgi:hypothetical protein